MNKEFLDAFADLKKEKNLSDEEIIGAIRDSIENAYKKNYGASNVRVEVDMETGDVTGSRSKKQERSTKNMRSVMS